MGRGTAVIEHRNGEAPAVAVSHATLPQPDRAPLPPGAADLAKALAPILVRGVPISPHAAGPILPNLPSVTTRAIHRRSHRSRVDALNAVLVGLVLDHPVDIEREALAVLLGIGSEFKGATLDQRRRGGALVLDCDERTFRTREEPKLLGALAEALLADSLSRGRRADVPAARSHSEERILHVDELLSRVWQHLHGLRAELLAAQRLGCQAAHAGQADEQRRSVERAAANLNTALRAAKEHCGQHLIDDEVLRHALQELRHMTLSLKT